MIGPYILLCMCVFFLCVGVKVTGSYNKELIKAASKQQLVGTHSRSRPNHHQGLEMTEIKLSEK